MTPPTSDVAFREGRSDRLVIRRFRAADAASLAAYRSDPATARYQSWDVPFSNAHARAFIDGLEGTNSTPRWAIRAQISRRRSSQRQPE
jgi:RimJ/RimL family protein N-acetyltransferase